MQEPRGVTTQAVLDKQPRRTHNAAVLPNQARPALLSWLNIMSEYPSLLLSEKPDQHAQPSVLSSLRDEAWSALSAAERGVKYTASAISDTWNELPKPVRAGVSVAGFVATAFGVYVIADRFGKPSALDFTHPGFSGFTEVKSLAEITRQTGEPFHVSNLTLDPVLKRALQAKTIELSDTMRNFKPRRIRELTITSQDQWVAQVHGRSHDAYLQEHALVQRPIERFESALQARFDLTRQSVDDNTSILAGTWREGSLFKQSSTYIRQIAIRHDLGLVIDHLMVSSANDPQKFLPVHLTFRDFSTGSFTSIAKLGQDHLRTQIFRDGTIAGTRLNTFDGTYAMYEISDKYLTKSATGKPLQPEFTKITGTVAS